MRRVGLMAIRGDEETAMGAMAGAKVGVMAGAIGVPGIIGVRAGMTGVMTGVLATG